MIQVQIYNSDQTSYVFSRELEIHFYGNSSIENGRNFFTIFSLEHIQQRERGWMGYHLSVTQSLSSLWIEIVR